MKKAVKSVVGAVKYFFTFRKPAFTEFHCIDLVAGNKLLFLMSWQIVHARLIKINPGRHRYRKYAGAVIVSLLPATDTVDVVIANLWRKTTIKVQLRHIALDNKSLQMLTNDLQVLSGIEIKKISPPAPASFEIIHAGVPAFSPFNFQMQLNPQFHYQKFVQDEP